MPARRSRARATWQAARWPPPKSVISGSSSVHRSIATGQRVWKRQPGGGAIGLGISPASSAGAQPARRVGDGDRLQQRLGVRVLRIAEHRPRVVPVSTIRPRYITATRWLMWRTTDRSCATNRIARPSSRCSSRQQVQDLRLHGDVERRDGLVGHDQLRVRAPAPRRSRRAAADRPTARADGGRRARATGRPGRAGRRRARRARPSVSRSPRRRAPRARSGRRSSVDRAS